MNNHPTWYRMDRASAEPGTGVARRVGWWPLFVASIVIAIVYIYYRVVSAEVVPPGRLSAAGSAAASPRSDNRPSHGRLLRAR